MTTTEKQSLIRRIIKEAWANETFKAELMADPVGSIEKFTGQKFVLPQGKKLVVRDQTNENTIFINIPQEPDFENMELSEEQLEAVAGGKTFEAIVDMVWNPLWDLKGMKIINNTLHVSPLSKKTNYN